MQMVWDQFKAEEIQFRTRNKPCLFWVEANLSNQSIFRSFAVVNPIYSRLPKRTKLRGGTRFMVAHLQDQSYRRRASRLGQKRGEPLAGEALLHLSTTSVILVDEPGR